MDDSQVNVDFHDTPSRSVSTYQVQPPAAT